MINSTINFKPIPIRIVPPKSSALFENFSPNFLPIITAKLHNKNVITPISKNVIKT